MLYRVLGQLAIQPRTPTAGKHRTLLTTLLVRANQPVPPSVLIDEIWADHPPRTATTTLHVYICQLRKILGEARLQTVPPGYVLHVRPEELDLSVFESLVHRGRRAYEQADLTGAVALLGEALALWSGPAFSGVPRGELLEHAAIRLDEVRLATHEQRIAADLRLGRHEELLDELIDLTNEHPLRETLHAHRLVALYRSGRPADALRAYAQARRIVVDELGVEPGPALRRLHERIVRSDPTLLWRGDREVAATDAVGWLPALPTNLVGRTVELGVAARRLRQGRLLVVSGRAGVGKTTFANSLAQRLRDAFPDGRVLVSLRSAEGAPLDPPQVLAALTRQLAGPGADGRGGATGPGRRRLAILDDAAGEAQVRAIAAAAPELTLLVTSRRPLPGLDSAQRISLSGLPPDDAVRLLGLVSGRWVDEAAARAIVQHCGYAPLAVRVAGAVLGMHPNWTGSELASRLAGPSALQILQAGDLDVRASLMASYRDLSADDQQALRRLALAPTPDFPPWCAAALLGGEASSSLDRLVEAQLLESDRTERYGYPPLLRALAAELLADDPAHDITAAVRRMGAACLERARRADAELSPGRVRGAPVDAGSEVPAAWFARELAGVVEAVRLAHAHGLWRLTWDLTSSLAGYLAAAARWDEWAETQQLGLDAARRAGARGAEADRLRSLGDLAWQRREAAAATSRYRAALRLFDELGDRAGHASCLVGLGDVAFGSGRAGEARSLYTAALQLSSGGAGPLIHADSLRGLALVAEQAGRRDEAHRHYENVRRTASTLGDRRWVEFARRGLQRTLLGTRPTAVEMRPGLWLVDAAA
jgi:DNA-binding SARP family transcriptional activator